LTYKYALPNSCPDILTDEINESCKLYRLVRNFPPTDEDFYPRAKINGYTSKPDKLSNPQYCKEWGVSTFYNVKDIFTILKSVRKKQKNSYIVYGTVVMPIHGILKATPSRFPSHCDWFPFKNVDEKGIINNRYEKNEN